MYRMMKFIEFQCELFFQYEKNNIALRKMYVNSLISLFEI